MAAAHGEDKNAENQDVKDAIARINEFTENAISGLDLKNIPRQPSFEVELSEDEHTLRFFNPDLDSDKKSSDPSPGIAISNVIETVQLILRWGRKDSQIKLSEASAQVLKDQMETLIRKIDSILSSDTPKTSHQRQSLEKWKVQINEDVIHKLPILKDPQWLAKNKGAGPGP